MTSAAIATGAPWKLPPETMSSSPVFDEDHRVVGGGSWLRSGAACATKVERLARRAVHLRRAAQRVGVLHAAAVLVRLVDRAVGEQPADVGRPSAPVRDTDGRRGCGRRRDAPTRAVRRSTGPPRHRRRARAARRRRAASAPTAVEGCVPLMSARPSLGASGTGVKPAAASASRPCRSAASSPTAGVPLANEDERQMCERRRSPLAPTEPRLGTTRVDAAIKQVDQPLERRAPNARVALRENVRAQRHCRPDGADRQRHRRRRPRDCAGG